MLWRLMIFFYSYWSGYPCNYDSYFDKRLIDLEDNLSEANEIFSFPLYIFGLLLNLDALCNRSEDYKSIFIFFSVMSSNNYF